MGTIYFGVKLVISINNLPVSSPQCMPRKCSTQWRRLTTKEETRNRQSRTVAGAIMKIRQRNRPEGAGEARWLVLGGRRSSL